MTRSAAGFLGLLIALIGLIASTTSWVEAAPMVFLSGRTDLTTPTSGFNHMNMDVNQISSLGGISYANRIGDRVRIVGIVRANEALVGNMLADAFDASFSTIGVYALEGRFTGNLTGNPATSVLSVDLDPITGGGSGQLRFYDHSAFVDPGDPANWVPDIGNLSDGLINVFNTADRPVDIQTGPPGPPATFLSDLFDPTLSNTSRVVQGTLGLEADTSIKFDLDQDFVLDGNSPLAPLFNFGPGQIANPDIPALLVDIDGLADLNPTGPGATLDPADLQALNDLFDGFLGLGGGFTNGDTFDPLNPATSGDTSQAISGGDAIPGSQVNAVPEPGSVAIWLLAGLVCAVGAASRVKWGRSN